MFVKYSAIFTINSSSCSDFSLRLVGRCFGFNDFPYDSVGCIGFTGPSRQYFSLYRAVPHREGERTEMIDERRNVKTTPTHTYCKRRRSI